MCLQIQELAAPTIIRGNRKTEATRPPNVLDGHARDVTPLVTDAHAFPRFRYR